MERRTTEVIVIGAGVAGLAAAAEIGRQGRQVALIEARDRLGGRILTARERGWGAPVELGAQFVHAGNAAFWHFLKRHRIGARRVPPCHWHWAAGGWSRIDATQCISAVTSTIDEQTMRGWSFAKFMRRSSRHFSPLQRELARGFVEGFEAAPAQKMSAVAVAGETLEDDEQYVLPSGYDRVIRALSAELVPGCTTLVLDAPCYEVRWRRGRVVVYAGDAEWEARALVVTLPAGVWQAGHRARGGVRFTPGLGRHAAAAAKFGVGHVIRITFRFDGRRWGGLLPSVLARVRKRGAGFIHTGLERVPVWWSLTADATMTGWAGGPRAIQLADKSEREIGRAALSELARLLGTRKANLTEALRGVVFHNWSRDPFSRGAYSYTRAGHDHAPRQLRAPLEGTLFFAGEATADGAEVGTVHGAYASGRRAAAEVAIALRS